MYVNPGECIDCGACIPVCPSNSIFPLDEVPADKQEYVAINEAHFA
jgi:NAD-dependent dihydropyrimidine dehydrogenase PreA subunit